MIDGPDPQTRASLVEIKLVDCNEKAQPIVYGKSRTAKIRGFATLIPDFLA